MLSPPPEFALVVLAVIIAAIWMPVVISRWSSAATGRGGSWDLEALVFLLGPGILLVAALQVQTQSGAILTVQRLLTGGTLVITAFALAKALASTNFSARIVLGLLAAFYAVLILSAFVGAQPTGVPYYYVVSPAIVFAFALRDDLSYEWLMTLMAWSLRAIVSLSFAAIAALPTVAFNLEESRNIAGIGRLAGITGHPNSLAAIALVGFLIERRLPKSNYFWQVAMILGVVLPQSSTGYVSIAICGGLLLVYRSRIALVGVWALAALLIGLSSFAPAQFDALRSSIEPERASTLTGRTAIWRAAMHGYTENPIFGYGPELFSEQYRWVYLPGSTAASHAHNQVIQSLASTGIVGLVILLALFGALFRRALSRAASTHGLPLALVAFLVLRSITESPLKPAGPSYATLLLAAIVALIVLAPADRANGQGANQAQDLAELPKGGATRFNSISRKCDQRRTPVRGNAELSSRFREKVAE